MQKIFKLALLCGGPSPERGISLNSARSVLDHLGSDLVEICPIYFDYQCRAYKISPAQLYSNTPSDFDFKLSRRVETQAIQGDGHTKHLSALASPRIKFILKRKPDNTQDWQLVDLEDMF
jgi:D-alanine-D-alanine ligase-like ATP-grasp enzyme